MATIAKKCSVCGALYRAYNYVEIPVSREDEEDWEYDDDEAIDVEVEEDFDPINFEPNGFEFITIKEDMDIQYDFDNNDLCPECMVIFENFVTGKIPSATGNPVVLEDAAPVNAVSVEVTGGSENTTITRVWTNPLDQSTVSKTYSLGDDIRLLTGSNTLTASEGTITIKYKKAIEGKMEVES